MTRLRTFLDALRGERGAIAIEYAFIAGLIAAVIIAAVVFVGRSTTESFACTGTAWETQTEAC